MKTVDEKDFFREVTLRICGTPEIEKALWDCLIYIRDYIPADEIFLNLYEPGTGVGETIVRADIHGGEMVSIKVAFPPRLSGSSIPRIRGSENLESIVVADHVGEHPLLSPFADVLKNPNTAVMAIGPSPKWRQFGGIFIANRGDEKYTEEHVRLFSMLEEPFVIAFVNYMRYREVLRLKDILADDNRYLQEELRRETGKR